MTPCKESPTSLDLDGLPLPLRIALLIEKHGPTHRYALAFWTGCNKRRGKSSGLEALDAALACGWFYAHKNRWRLSNDGVLALRRHREKHQPRRQ